jgi:hypothetical protein
MFKYSISVSWKGECTTRGGIPAGYVSDASRAARVGIDISCPVSVLNSY